MKRILTGCAVAAALAVAIPAFAQDVAPAAQQSASDVQLQHEVTHQLTSDRNLEGSMLVVSVLDGRVNVVGTLRDHSQETEIYSVARHVDGVRSVFVFADAGSQ
ncbi:hypothetical protein BWI17_04100 [Betaproteobacteria bacterium GR16-43]|nr:hypothetical protein BWI17_04100 [Betaproteobacteria bacterium GR16-43]